MSNPLFVHLSSFSEADWLSSIGQLLPSIHEVDRDAVQIWFRFYPLDLHRCLSHAENQAEARHAIAMQGDFGLAARIDSSHYFLFGHRYWPEVKAAIEKRAVSSESGFENLESEIVKIADSAASAAGIESSLTIAISAVGLMTFAQVGLEALIAASGKTKKPTGIMAKSPEKIAAIRSADDSQGLFGFLRTINKKFSVIFDEYNRDSRFEVIEGEEIASASQRDHSQNWQERDIRCWNGPVPIECTAASCGTCWVGILGGAEKVSEVAPRERRAMKVFGYNQPEAERPFLRLACQAKATGNVTIVIPPWNAVFGKKVRGNVDELELEPATSSAKKLRETIASVSGE